MKEDFLHYIWRLQRFDHRQLRTTSGESIQLVAIGEYNQHAGPDFSNARIRIGETLWAGNVEIHLKASEWLRHGHQHDRAYDNVILHVVLEEDEVIWRPDGEPLPCLELQKRIDARLAKNYLRLLQQQSWIPCQTQIAKVAATSRLLWLDRMLVERLEDKTTVIRNTLEQTKNNWEESFYRLLARSYGLKVNPDAFEQLARSLPLSLLGRHKNDLRQIEALFFGQAGMLEGNFTDAYPKKLKKEYRFLRKKYHLQPMPLTNWKFLRLRPANFPTIRIAQLAMLIHQTNHLFSKILAVKNVKEIEHMFDRRVSAYWQDHYVFDKKAKRSTKNLGRFTIHLFVINTIAPFLFHFGKQQDEERYTFQALRLLEELKPEKNQIIRRWENLGLKPESAYHSQALLQLKKQYCDKRRCLQCAIGHAILKGRDE